MGGKCSCCCLPCGAARDRARKTRQAAYRPGPTANKDPDGGFTVDVVAAGGLFWRLGGMLPHHTAGELKERLMGDDVRFRTHRADLVLGNRVLGDAESLSAAGAQSSRVVAVFTDLRAAVLVLGGGVAGRRAIEELSPVFKNRWIVCVDAQEYSEHASGLFRAYVNPEKWNEISMKHEDALKRYANVRFVQGECTHLRPNSATCTAFDGAEFIVRFEYCIIATGCSWGSVRPSGESLWKPSAISATREASEWPAHDERTMVGRQRHIEQEHMRLWELDSRSGSVLVVGADVLGVEWACDLKMFFPNLSVTIVDNMPRCLSSLPVTAAEYAERFMSRQNIRTFYEVTYEPNNPVFWKRIDTQPRADLVYVATGIQAHNHFMPQALLSTRGPGGGGWILTNTYLQVCFRSTPKTDRQTADLPGEVWAAGRVFAVGDCHYGAVKGQRRRAASKFLIPPVPRSALGAVNWAQVACKNIVALTKDRALEEAEWPPEVGVVAMGLGPPDGVVTWKVTWVRDSGEVILKGTAAMELKHRLSLPDKDWLARPSTWVDTLKSGIGRRYI